MKNMKNKRNHGFSMVELVIVVGIMATMIGLLVPNLLIKYSTEAKTCAKRIDEMIGECRIKQMSRLGEYSVRFSYGPDGLYGVYVENGVSREPEKIAGAAMMFVDEDGNKITGDITFTFERSTGVVKSVTGALVTLEDGVYKLWVTARMKTYGVEVTGLTGRHKVIPQ